MGIRKYLHLIRNGNSYTCPPASYTMTFCEFLRSLKFPDGYASNLEKHVTIDGCNLQGLKTHDCYIILQRTLAADVWRILHKDIYEAIANLGNFFQQLCAKTLKVDVLKRLKDEIPVILCKLEKIFSPCFFDICLHLTVHLREEAFLRGPTKYGWMCPVERMLCTLKCFVRNRTRPKDPLLEWWPIARGTWIVLTQDIIVRAGIENMLTREKVTYLFSSMEFIYLERVKLHVLKIMIKWFGMW